MSRRPDPARILEARRAALRQRLIGDGLLPEQADGWIAAWMQRGPDPSTSSFWEQGYGWISDQRLNGRAPFDGDRDSGRL